MELFYFADSWMHGPVDIPQIIQLLEEKEINPDTLVWMQTNDNWMYAGMISSLANQENSDETPVIEFSHQPIDSHEGAHIPRPREMYALKLAREQGLITSQQSQRCLGEMMADPNKAYDVPGKLHRRGWITAGQRSSLACLSQAQPDQIIIAGYELLEKLGSGSMGTTYRARQISLDRILALKLLLPRYSQDPDYIRRFMREARLAAKLNHENIATAYEVGSSGSQYFLAMELVEGRTLAEIIEEDGPLGQGQAIEIIINICNALQHAHEIGIIHRDISPKNIIVRRDGIAKLIDLGLAKNIGGQNTEDSETAVGTPAYLSPEQALGRKNIDIRSDIYSLGCVFYEILSGKPPFKGESALETISMHLNHNVPTLKGNNISQLVKRAVKKMTHRNPNRRYQEPREILEDLEGIAELSRHEMEEIPPVMQQLEKWKGVQPVEIIMRSNWREYMHLIAQEIDEKLEKDGIDHEFQGYVQTTFMELVSNAFDHGCKGDELGTIRLHMELNKAFFRIEVEDDGSGFAANQVLQELREAPPDRERQRGLIQLLQIVDILEYNETGNRVKAVLYRKSRGSGIFEETRDGIHFAEIKGKGDMALTEEFRRWVDNLRPRKGVNLCLMVRTDWVSSMFVGSITRLASKIEENNGQLAVWVERASCRRIMHQLGINTFVEIFGLFEKAVNSLRKVQKLQ